MDLGSALAVASLSFQMVGACVKAIGLICEAKNMAPDAYAECLRLLVQQYRLLEWARAANLMSPDSQPDERLNMNIAALILTQLESNIASVEVLKKRYKLELSTDLTTTLASQGSALVPATEEWFLAGAQPKYAEIKEYMQEHIHTTSRGVPFAKKLWWASFDKKKFHELVADVKSLVDSLWSLLEPLQRLDAAQTLEHVFRTVIATSSDISALRGLLEGLQHSFGPGDVHMFGPESGVSALSALRISRIEAESVHAAGPQAALDRKAPQIFSSARFNDTLWRTSLLGTHTIDDRHVLIEVKRVDPHSKRKLRYRVEELGHLLGRRPTPNFPTLEYLGYAEEQQGFYTIFELPQASSYTVSLLQVLRAAKSRMLPSAGVRHKLSLRLCHALHSIWSAGWMHKDLRSDNVLFFNSDQANDRASIEQILSQAYLVGFSFAKKDHPLEISEQPSEDLARDIYRHPQGQGEESEGSTIPMDAYSLGCILVEIAEWSPLARLLKDSNVMSSRTPATTANVASIQPYLLDKYIASGSVAYRLGSIYADITHLCLSTEGTQPSTDFLQKFSEMLAKLEQCRC